jgi:hypothetical protein
MDIKNYTQEELDALKKQTDAITANLKYIAKHPLYQGEDLGQLRKLLAAVLGGLKQIQMNGASS